MQQIPNISAGDLQKLDEKIAMGGTKGNKIDKAKRDLFKKITGQVGGQVVIQGECILLIAILSLSS